MTIEAEPIDPRDGRWEKQPDAYRVYFWEPAREGMLLAGGEPMMASEEYELTGARNIAEVLDWAKANANSRMYTVYAVIDRVQSDRGLVHLYGTDPTRND